MGYPQVHSTNFDGPRVRPMSSPRLASVLRKILRRILIASYQVRYALLDAADYGAPQSRRRMIYMASQHGLALPNFLSPTHHSPSPPPRQIQASWGFVPVVPHRNFFAHLPVSIQDAIGDLPRFDW